MMVPGLSLRVDLTETRYGLPVGQGKERTRPDLKNRAVYELSRLQPLLEQVEFCVLGCHEAPSAMTEYQLLETVEIGGAGELVELYKNVLHVSIGLLMHYE